MAETKVTERELSDTLLTGWIPIIESWSVYNVGTVDFVLTVPTGAASRYSAGMRVRLTDDSEVKYFIITAVADTKVTIYGGTDYAIGFGGVSSISYSTQKAPLGFPLDPDKWTIEVSSSTNDAVSDPTSTDWQNITSITIPIGVWKTEVSAALFAIDDNSHDYIQARITLSKANNTEDDVDFSTTCHLRATFSSSYGLRDCHNSFVSKILNISSSDIYYLNLKTGYSLGAGGKLQLEGTQATTIIRAICAYL